jgi:hypothetical protein
VDAKDCSRDNHRVAKAVCIYKMYLQYVCKIYRCGYVHISEHLQHTTRRFSVLLPAAFCFLLLPGVACWCCLPAPGEASCFPSSPFQFFWACLARLILLIMLAFWLLLYALLCLLCSALTGLLIAVLGLAIFPEAAASQQNGNCRICICTCIYSYKLMMSFDIQYVCYF